MFGPEPVDMPEWVQDIASIHAGHYNAFVLVNNSTDAVVWGSCKDGQGTLNERGVFETPQRCDLSMLDAPPVHIAAGRFSTMFLTRTGSLFSCGNGSLEGMSPLGYSHDSYQMSLRKVKMPVPLRYLATGWGHTLAIGVDDRLYGFGVNMDGQLGFSGDAARHRTHPELLPFADQPFAHLVQKVACGLDHSLVLTCDGQLYSAGLNDHGQLGLGHTGPVTGFHRVPVGSSLLNTDNDRMVDVVCGWSQSMVLLQSGRVLAFGWNDSGRLGLGQQFNKTGAVLSPTSVPLEEGRVESKVKAISLGRAHSALLDENGRLYTCGMGRFGRLGTGEMGDAHCFAPVDALEGMEVLSVSCGLDFTLALVNQE